MQDEERGRFSVSNAFSQASGIFADHAVYFFAIFFICGLPATLVSGLLGESTAAAWVTTAILLLGLAFAEPSVAWATLSKLDDPGAKPTGAMERGIAHFGPVFVANLIFTGAFFIGLIALILPGLFIYSLWFFFVPLIVEERCGVIESLERSAVLGRGIRGEVFMLAFIYFILFVLISWLPTIVLDKIPIFGALISLVLNSGIGAFGSVLAAVAYRQIKMGSETPLDIW